MYLDEDGEEIPEASLRGHLAVGVPGTVAGLALATNLYGKLSLSENLQPAIRAAEDGFPVHEILYQRTEILEDLLRRFPATEEIFLPNGEKPKLGEILIQSDLAKTMRAVAEEGPDVFYQGWIAEAIAQDMAENGGLITLEDLKNYQPQLREPVRGSYRGYEIVTMPPPSSGGVHLIQMLNILEAYDLSKDGPGGSRNTHLITEAMRRAFADRAEYLGDPAFVDVPVNGLISKDYAKLLRNSIVESMASSSTEIGPGIPGDFQESPSTTHLSIIDQWGNAVSLTATINYSFGSGVTVPGTGILLNNEMDDFSIKPGVPNVYGLVGAEANAIAPGKIPLSSMTPTLVFDEEGELFLILGSPGGPRIITTVLHTIINRIDYGMNIQEAIDWPRFHHQWLPDQIFHERWAFSKDTRDALERMGHKLEEGTVWSNAMAIERNSRTGEVFGASDSRGVGKAIGQ